MFADRTLWCLFSKNKCLSADLGVRGMHQKEKGTVTEFAIKGNGERSTSLHTEINFKPQAALFFYALQKSGNLVRLCAAAVPYLCRTKYVKNVKMY